MPFIHRVDEARVRSRFHIKYKNPKQAICCVYYKEHLTVLHCLPKNSTVKRIKYNLKKQLSHTRTPLFQVPYSITLLIILFIY